MSQAERLVRQQEASRLQAEAFERQRAALASKPLVVYVASCFRFLPWRDIHFSQITFDSALGIQRHFYPSTRSRA